MKKKIKNTLIFTSTILLVIFIGLYILSLTSYYETVSTQNNVLSKEAIKRFEKDVLKGETIEAKNYLNEKKDYTNLLSRIGIKIGDIIEKLFKKGISTLLKEIESVME